MLHVASVKLCRLFGALRRGDAKLRDIQHDCGCKLLRYLTLDDLRLSAFVCDSLR